jgi:RNA polymerase sigma-70 factor (ECF subfamily)
MRLVQEEPPEPMTEPDGQPAPCDPLPELESTAFLLAQVREGDAKAEERLLLRYQEPLAKLARRLLPAPSRRDLTETQDLVSHALLKALEQVRQGKFVPRGEGAFLAYLRAILHNAAIDDANRRRRKPRWEELSPDMADPSPSPLLRAIGRQRLGRFERALDRLPERKREAVILRIEFHYSYEQIAEAVGYRTPSAARMQIVRSLVWIAEHLDEH